MCANYESKAHTHSDDTHTHSYVRIVHKTVKDDNIHNSEALQSEGRTNEFM